MHRLAVIVLALAGLACGSLLSATPNPTETAARARLSEARATWERIIFEDDFSGEVTGGSWDLSPVPSRFGEVETTRADGTFTMQGRADEAVIWWQVPTIDEVPTPPYLIEVTSSTPDNSDPGAYGLVFWRANSAAFTIFAVQDFTNDVRVERNNNETWVTLVTLANIEAAPVGEPITLSVIVNADDTADLFINAQWVETITAVGTYGHEFGLMLTHSAGTEADATFNTFRVTAP
jgi:hypothetical protein